MKFFLSFVLAVCMAMPAFAQFKVLGSSAEFPEPQYGSLKIIKAQSGNTYYLLFGGSYINIKSFDSNIQLIYDKKVELDKGRGTGIFAYEINNQLVCFTYYLENHAPQLRRVILDAGTANLLSEELIAHYDKIDMRHAFALSFGGVPEPDFFIRKDEKTNHYAVALFNTLVEDRNKRIEILHYNDKHELISRSFYNSPNDGYKYMVFLDLYVDGAKAVYVVAKGMNTKKSGGDQNGALFIAKLNAGSTAFDMNKISYAGAKNIENVILRYNEPAGKFIMITNKAQDIKKARKDRKYIVYMATFDKELHDFTNKQLLFSEINRVAKTQYKKKESINAIPQSLFVNTDGSYTIVLEEAYIKVVNGIDAKGAARTSTRYFFKDIGVTRYDKDGNVLGYNYIPKSQQVFSLPVPIFYSFRNEMAHPLSSGEQFKSFQYLEAAGKNYVLFNDIEANQKKMKAGKKLTTIQALHDCEGYAYDLSKKGMPEGKKVVTNNNKKIRNLLLFTAGCYDRENNQYIVLNRVLDGGKKYARLMWLQPE